MLTLDSARAIVRLDDLEIRGSIFLKRGTLEITNCVFLPQLGRRRRLQAGLLTAGQYAVRVDAGFAVMTSVTFDASHIRAVLVSSGEVTLRDCRLTNYVGATYGGAMWVRGGQVWLIRSSLLYNRAQFGGAIALSGNTSVVYMLNQTQLLGNAANVSGSSIYKSAASTLTYKLPAPLGRWVFAQEAADAAWIATESSEEINADYPYACNAGLKGAGYTPREQSTPLCSGPCTAGTYCPAASVYELPCSRGNYCPQGSGFPTNCPAGRYGSELNLTRESACILCSEGFACRVGSVAQSPCLPGEFQPQSGSSACIACAVGTYQPLSNGTACAACQPGYYCSRLDAFACPNATFNEDFLSSNISACKKCRTFATSPEASASGTACLCNNDELGVVPLDESLPVHASPCGCPRGKFFSNIEGVCSDCPPHTSAKASPSASCDVCAAGYFLRYPADVASEDSCVSCFTGMHCGWNSTLRTVTLLQGYWRLTDRSARIEKCELLAGVSENGTNGSSVCQGGEPAFSCLPGHSGPLCQVCNQSDTYFDAGTGSCIDCPDEVERFSIMFGIIVACLVPLFVAVFIYYSSPKRLPRQLVPFRARLRGSVRNVRSAYENTGLQAKLKITISFYQVSTTLTDIYGLRPPPFYTSWVSAFSFLRDVDWTSLAMPSDCLITTFRTSLLLRCLGPILLFLIILCESIRRQCFQVIQKWRKGAEEEGDEDDSLCSNLHKAVIKGSRDVLPLILVISFIFVPSVSTKIFSANSCVGYGYDDTTSPGEDRYFLRDDPSVICYDSDDHKDLITLMWAFAVVWPIGVVVLYAVLLYPCKAAILAGKRTPLVEATFFLTHDYEPFVFFWEPFELLRRTTLTGWVLLIHEQYNFIRLLIGLLVSSIFLVALLSIKPYKRPEDDLLAILSQLMLVVLFFGCMLLKLFVDIRDAAGTEIASDILVFESEDQVVVILIVTTFAMVILLVFITLSEALKSYHQSIEQDKWGCCTVHTPTCNWDPKHKFCTFVSHYKMEAASDARYIHDILRKMLKCPVYLDSSTLSDLRTLFTEGVHQSDVILLLATPGVLTRPWCLLEILEATKTKIPILPVGMTGKTWDIATMRAYINNLEAEMTQTNPTALTLLNKHTNDDLTELKAAVNAVLDTFESNPRLVWNPHAGDRAILASLQDIVERMAVLTDREIAWDPETGDEADFLLNSLTGFWNCTLGRLFRLCFKSKASEADMFMTFARQDCITDAKVLQSELQLVAGKPVAFVAGHEEHENVLAKWLHPHHSAAGFSDSLTPQAEAGASGTSSAQTLAANETDRPPSLHPVGVLPPASPASPPESSPPSVPQNEVSPPLKVTFRTTQSVETLPVPPNFVRRLANAYEQTVSMISKGASASVAASQNLVSFERSSGGSSAERNSKVGGNVDESSQQRGLKARLARVLTASATVRQLVGSPPAVDPASRTPSEHNVSEPVPPALVSGASFNAEGEKLPANEAHKGRDLTHGVKAVLHHLTHCQTVIILLTKNVLSRPECLYTAFRAIVDEKLLIPVFVDRGGYDYAAAQELLNDLEKHLGEEHPDALASLNHMLEVDYVGRDIPTIAHLQLTLRSALPNLIAITWQPQAGRNHTTSVVHDILARVTSWQQHRIEKNLLKEDSVALKGEQSFFSLRWASSKRSAEGVSPKDYSPTREKSLFNLPWKSSKESTKETSTKEKSTKEGSAKEVSDERVPGLVAADCSTRRPGSPSTSVKRSGVSSLIRPTVAFRRASKSSTSEEMSAQGVQADPDFSVTERSSVDVAEDLSSSVRVDASHRV